MQTENRKHSRSGIFLIIHFRLLQNSYEYSLGIAKDYSRSGFSMESHKFHYKQGHILECTLTHPESDTSLSILGEVVWKKDGWYDAVMGIKFLHMDKNKFETLQHLAEAGQKKREPVIAKGPAISTGNESIIHRRTPHFRSSGIREVRPEFHKRERDEPVQAVSSAKPRRLYYLLYLILGVGTLIMFSIASQDGIDSIPRAYLAGHETFSAAPVQGDMSVSFTPAASFTPPLSEKNSTVPDTEAFREKLSPRDPGHLQDIIRDAITFDVNSCDISEQFSSVIDKAADILLGNPDLIVKLEGHTDGAGSNVYNMDLSLRRAEAVQRELVKKGIRTSRIKLICYGNSNPVASNDIESGRMKNRRVEIVIPGAET